MGTVHHMFMVLPSSGFSLLVMVTMADFDGSDVSEVDSNPLGNLYNYIIYRNIRKWGSWQKKNFGAGSDVPGHKNVDLTS